MFFVTASRLLLDKLFFIVCISSLQFKETIQQKKNGTCVFLLKMTNLNVSVELMERLKRHTEPLAVECRVINCHCFNGTIGSFISVWEELNIEHLRGEKKPNKYSHINNSNHFFFNNLCSSHVHVHTITHRAAAAKFNSQQVTMEFSGRQGNVVREIKSTLESQNEVCLCVCVCASFCPFTTAAQHPTNKHTRAQTHTRLRWAHKRRMRAAV